jgi:drug/metabolite transporter (DMT)-like permease
MKKELKSKIIAWGILIGLVIIWGSSFILIKNSLQFYSSEVVGAMRIVISFLFLLPFAIPRLHKIKKSEWKYLAIIGVVGSLAPSFLFAKAQTGIASNLAGILNSLTPLFTLVVGLLFFRLKTRWYNVLGVMLGLLGAIGLISVSGGQTFSFNFSYAIYIIIATLCYAINVNVVKKYLKGPDAISITSISFFILGLPIVIYTLLFTDFISEFQTQENAYEGLIYIAILAIFGTGLALIAFNYLIKISTVIFAASVTYLIPIVAVIWGILDGELFETAYVMWILVILLGVFLVNLNYQNAFVKRITKFLLHK